LRPLVSYVTDKVGNIWSQNPGGFCTDCHKAAGSPQLKLDGNPSTGISCALGYDCSYKSIIGRGDVVAPPFHLTSPIIACPSGDQNTTNCPSPTMRAQTPKIPSGSTEYSVLQFWLGDGAKF
jgi:hypothetical protein